MRVLDREAIYISFLEQLKNADRRILLLDYDGTMAPFHKDRTHAFPYPEIPPLVSVSFPAPADSIPMVGRARDGVCCDRPFGIPVSRAARPRTGTMGRRRRGRKS